MNDEILKQILAAGGTTTILLAAAYMLFRVVIGRQATDQAERKAAQDLVVSTLQDQISADREDRAKHGEALSALVANIGKHTEVLDEMKGSLNGVCKFKHSKARKPVGG